MTLHLASFVKYEVRTPEEQIELERKIELLDQHMYFAGNVTPLRIAEETGKVGNQFLVRWRNEAVEIRPIGGKLPDYRLSSVGRDNVERMLNVHDQPEHTWVSLRTSLQEEYKHYYLFRNPE